MMITINMCSQNEKIIKNLQEDLKLLGESIYYKLKDFKEETNKDLDEKFDCIYNKIKIIIN
jgi:hypothetical protein